MLCAVLVAGVGTGIVTAKQAPLTPQKGHSPILQVDVKNDAGKVIGKLVVNAEKHTFVFNGTGLAPGRWHELRYSTSSGTYVVGGAKATKAGTMHLTGMWAGRISDVSAATVTVTTTEKQSATLYIVDILREDTPNGLYVSKVSMIGTLTDANNKPIVGRSIQLYHLDASNPTNHEPIPGAIATTDQNGWWYATNIDVSAYNIAWNTYPPTVLGAGFAGDDVYNEAWGIWDPYIWPT